MLQDAKSILITGGCGTLGRAILKRATDEKWGCKITVFSRDAMKHLAVKKMFPHVDSVIGDIRDATTLYNVMAGKDVVVHAAAVKHIPVSEKNSIDTYQVNVEGSLNVAQAAIQHNVKHVLGISTDKACHAANAYGSTKYLLEKIFQEFSRLNLSTQFHLVRYGNVLESTGSVIEVWKNQITRGEPIKITDLEMTRFYISPSQAVDLVLSALETPSGQIFIPKMKALSIKKLAEYTVADVIDIPVEIVPIRPGEKKHETLLTLEEGWYASDCAEFGEFKPLHSDYFILKPTTSERYPDPISPYTSDIADQLTKDELTDLLNDDHG